MNTLYYAIAGVALALLVMLGLSYLVGQAIKFGMGEERDDDQL